MILESEPDEKIYKYTGITEARLNEIYIKMLDEGTINNRLTENVGKIHDIDLFMFEGDLEEYFT